MYNIYIFSDSIPGPGVNGNPDCAELTELLLRGDPDPVVQHRDLGVLSELAGGDVGGRGQAWERLRQARGRGGGRGGAPASEGGDLESGQGVEGDLKIVSLVSFTWTLLLVTSFLTALWKLCISETDPG